MLHNVWLKIWCGMNPSSIGENNVPQTNKALEDLGRNWTFKFCAAIWTNLVPSLQYIKSKIHNTTSSIRTLSNILLFNSITMLCGIDNIPNKIF